MNQGHVKGEELCLEKVNSKISFKIGATEQKGRFFGQPAYVLGVSEKYLFIIYRYPT